MAEGSIALPPHRSSVLARHINNRLLARLDPNVLDEMAPFLAIVHLEQGRVLAKTQGVIEKVYFPHGGIISCIVETLGGAAIETGMIGKEGQFGAGPALANKVSLNHVVVQVACDVSIMEFARFQYLAEQHPSLRMECLAYEQFMIAQTQQTAACNAIHGLRQRICKCFLRMQKLVGDDLPLTQEFLSQMMGVRRTSVTQEAVDMQRQGMIKYHRGNIHIVDLAMIKRRACECDATVDAHYSRMFK
jgi:CRP-like cAMP-binding protein